MCDDPSETFLSLWHMQKGFFRARDIICMVEPCPLQLQELAIFFFCAACDSLPAGFKLCLVFSATDAADESQGILQQGVLLHAKHKLES